MRKTSVLIGAVLVASVSVTGALLLGIRDSSPEFRVPVGKYGAYLAAQHAVYVNDFDAAAEFAGHFKDADYPVVQNTVTLTEFLSGKLPKNAGELRDEKNAALRFIYDAHLVTRGDWAGLYARHKSDDSPLASPLRIWAAVGAGHADDALKFIEGQGATDDWKSFMRGQIYAETNRVDKAAEQFKKVSVDFMNIGDYMYIMAFYAHNKMSDAAASLRDTFTARPGGMYMLNSEITPDFAGYNGIGNALAFGLVQNVSHTQIMMYSDLSLLMLRFAEIARGGADDALNYYIGQYFYNNGGDYMRHFDRIATDGPFYAFARMKIAEKTSKTRDLERVADANPLFVPAITKLVAKHVQSGERRAALRVVNDALDHDNLTEIGQAFLLKTRADIYMAFGDVKDAQGDIRAAADILPMDLGILAIQARIWATEKRELNTAYEYAMNMVTMAPTDIGAWDTLGRVVAARDGADAGLELIEQVGEVAATHSALFDQLGDLYAAKGDVRRARDAWLRAIELSDDGLVVVPRVREKLEDLQ